MNKNNALETVVTHSSEVIKPNEVKMIEIILKQNPELFDSEQYIDLMKHTLHKGKSDAFSVLMSALLEHDLAQDDGVKKMTERYKKIAPQLQGIYVDLDVCRNTGMNPEYCIMPAEMELPMQWAALRAQVPLLKKMIAAGMDVNEQDCRGYTALHAGTVGYSKEAVDVLLKAGSDVNLTSETKETALDLLCRGNYTWKEPYEVATALLKAGSKPAENLNGFINNMPSSFLSEKEELKGLADQATKMQQINSQKILSVQKASEGR